MGIYLTASYCQNIVLICGGVTPAAPLGCTELHSSMKSSVKKESAAQKAWPTSKRGHGLRPAKYYQSILVMVSTEVWTEQTQTAGDVTCCSAGNTMLVLYIACETSSIDTDAGSLSRQMPGRLCLGSGCRGSRDLHSKSRKVPQPCGRGHRIGTNCMLGSCAGPHHGTLQCNLRLLFI